MHPLGWKMVNWENQGASVGIAQLHSDDPLTDGVESYKTLV